MRIISKQHQYYDGLQSHDKDDILFVRKPEFIGKGHRWSALFSDLSRPALPGDSSYLQPKLEKLVIRPKGCKPLFTGSKNTYLNTPSMLERVIYEAIAVVFCGKLYRGVSYVEKWSSAPGTKPIIYWTAEALLEQHELRPRQYKFERMLTTDDIFEAPESNKYLEACLELQAPIIGVGRNPSVPDYPIEDDQYGVMTNVDLDKIQFYKVFDPAEAFQELSMFIGGVMAKTDKPEPQSNRGKIEGHGFDYRDSFRKGPTKEHR
jgi:hypothetical protein